MGAAGLHVLRLIFRRQLVRDGGLNLTVVAGRGRGLGYKCRAQQSHCQQSPYEFHYAIFLFISNCTCHRSPPTHLTKLYDLTTWLIHSMREGRDEMHGQDLADLFWDA